MFWTSGTFVDVMFGMANFSWYGFVMSAGEVVIVVFWKWTCSKWVFMVTLRPDFFLNQKPKK